MKEYDLTDKTTVAQFLQLHLDWLNDNPSCNVVFGSYGPNLSDVIKAAVNMMKD